MTPHDHTTKADAFDRRPGTDAVAETAGSAVLRLEIRGRVQGVGYRWAMVEQARLLGVGSWVRNHHDGSVEAVVAGSREAVERLLDWARRGPRTAAVSTVDVFPDAGAFDGFAARPTA